MTPALSHRWAQWAATSALMTLLAVTPFSTASAATSASAAGAGAWPDISGIYWTNSYSAKIQPVGGGDPPYTAAAMAAYKKNMAAVKTYALDDKARKLCTPDGVPRILESPYPFEIVQSPDRGEIHLIYELNHVIRLVTMTKPLPSADELETFPFYSGHSAGHWDGDTLVIETAGFNEKTFLDNSGAPAHRSAAHRRAHPQDQWRQGARGRRHHPRSRRLHQGLERAFRLPGAARHPDDGLCVRRKAPRPFVGQGRSGPLGSNVDEPAHRAEPHVFGKPFGRASSWRRSGLDEFGGATSAERDAIPDFSSGG